MPELPDVEVYKRRADDCAVGRRIRRVHVPEPKILDGTSPQAIGRQLHASTLQRTRRHGKFLFLACDRGQWLVLHFGMSGRLESFECSQPAPAHTDFSLEFDDQSCLAYVAPRKLGLVALAGDPDQVITEHGLGADALGLDETAFLDLAAGHRAGVKCWLMNQQIIAGLGNVYSDEVLYRARMHPKTKVSDLGAEALRDLFAALSEVLRISIDAQAEPQRMPQDFLLPQREQGARCPRCGGAISQIQACGRTAYLCPDCQPPD